MTQESEIEVQDNSAVYYEKRYSGYGLKYHKTVIDWMMDGIFFDHKVLDAGCGTGIISRIYTQYDISGIDISNEMISRCPRWRVPKYNDDGKLMYSFSYGRHNLGTVDNIPGYVSGSMDAVVCRSLLHHLPDHKKALKEFHRVLKPGGKLVCWETNRGWLAQRVRERTQHGDRFSAYHHAFKPGELEKDLQEAGFKVEEVRYMGFFAYPLFGFPDIANISKYIPFKPILFPLSLAVDYLLESTPFVNKLSWAVGIRATKI